MGRSAVGRGSGSNAGDGIGTLTLEYVESDTDSDGGGPSEVRAVGFKGNARSETGLSAVNGGQGAEIWRNVREIGSQGVVGPPREATAGGVPLRSEVLNKLKKLEQRAHENDLKYRGQVFGPTLKERKGKSSQEPAECGWFSMPSTKLTEQTQQDLTILSMRNCFGPVGLYKSEGRKGIPKWFQIGSVVDDPTAPPSHRLTKRLRRRSLAQQLLSGGTREQLQKRFRAIQDTRTQQAHVLKKNYPALHKRQKMHHGRK